MEKQLKFDIFVLGAPIVEDNSRTIMKKKQDSKAKVVIEEKIKVEVMAKKKLLSEKEREEIIDIKF